MSKLVKKLTVLLLALVLMSCSALSEKKEYREFLAQKTYPKTYSIYQDKELLKLKNKTSSKVVVDTKTQRLRLVINGQTAIDTPTTTGSSKKRDRNTGKVKNKTTPKGTFEITEKLRDKRSNIFGRLYNKNKLVYSGDKRKYKGKYDHYKGASLRNWMRLTDGGIGIHASNGIKRYPASNGCIRVPHSVASKIYSKVNRGTTVTVK